MGDAREELAEALSDDIAVAPALGRLVPPCAVIFGAGVDTTQIVRGQAEAGFRVMLEAGRADQEASALELDEMILTAIGVLRSLAGWRLGTVGPATIRMISAAEILTADVVGHRFVDIT